MVAGLLEEIEQVLSGDEFQQEKEIRGCLQRAVEGDDIRMSGQQLVNSGLKKRKCKD